MKRLLLIPFSLAPLLLLGGCLIGTDLRQDHVSGPYYFWAFEAASQTQFVEEDKDAGRMMAFANPITLVDAPVTAAGWDTAWVLIQQDSNKFYIFDLGKKKINGPFTQAQFTNQRARLGVPNGLKFTQDYTRG
jgi:hypothetical protein